MKYQAIDDNEAIVYLPEFQRLASKIREVCTHGLARCKSWSRKHRDKIPCIQHDIEELLEDLDDFEFEMETVTEKECYGAIGGQRSLVEDIP